MVEKVIEKTPDGNLGFRMGVLCLSTETDDVKLFFIFVELGGIAFQDTF